MWGLLFFWKAPYIISGQPIAEHLSSLRYYLTNPCLTYEETFVMFITIGKNSPSIAHLSGRTIDFGR